MKKIIVLSLLLIFLFTGCKQNNPSSNITLGNNNDIQYYDKFLNNEISAITSTGTIFISNFIRSSDGKPGIDKYAFFDSEKYEVPLLHIQALEHSVFYFDGENVVLLYSSPITRLEGKIDILKDGTVYSTHSSLGGTQYYFAEFLGDTNIEITEFYDPGSINNDVAFSFNCVPLSKEEFEIKIKPFLKSTDFPADINWLTWK